MFAVLMTFKLINCSKRPDILALSLKALRMTKQMTKQVSLMPLCDIQVMLQVQGPRHLLLAGSLGREICRHLLNIPRFMFSYYFSFSLYNNLFSTITKTMLNLFYVYIKEV